MPLFATVKLGVKPTQANKTKCAFSFSRKYSLLKFQFHGITAKNLPANKIVTPKNYAFEYKFGHNGIQKIILLTYFWG